MLPKSLIRVNTLINMCTRSTSKKVQNPTNISPLDHCGGESYTNTNYYLSLVVTVPIDFYDVIVLIS